MEHFYSVLKTNTLFRNFSLEEMEKTLPCLECKIISFSKNQIIRDHSQIVEKVGIIVSGLVYITKIDYEGKRTILSRLVEGNCFGESLALTRAENSPIIIVSATNSDIAFLSIDKIINPCDTTCVRHSKLIRNLITLLAEKIVLLQMKNDILSQKNTREKLLLYFEYEARSAGSKSFCIKFSRQELADFLCLNVSAMSRELGRMREEGILTFFRNEFVLKHSSHHELEDI